MAKILEVSSYRSSTRVPVPIDIAPIFAAAKKLNYPIFNNGLINIWGIRTEKGEWNDVFYIFHMINNQWDFVRLVGTTEPSSSYIDDLFKTGTKNPNGIFILKPGFYQDCWKRGKHKEKYNALKQSIFAKFVGYRKKKDDLLYYDGPLYNDVVGLNFHSTKLGYAGKYIGGYSEGCQVVLNWSHYTSAINMIYSSFQDYFSYALIKEEDLIL